MEPEDLRWQVWWVYVGAWWGQKAKMLKKHWFYHYFLKGQEGHEDAKAANNTPSRGEKVRFLLKNVSWLYSELSFLLQRGAHFHTNREKSGRMVKNGAKIMSDTSLLHQAGVGYIKMSWKLSWMHHWSRPKKPPVEIIHRFARVFEVQLGRHGADKRRKERTTER